MRKIKNIVIHHSVTPRDLPLEQQITSFDRTHKARLHPVANEYGLHIAYHYVIAGDGTYKKTRPLDKIGYHAGNWAMNKTSIGICLCGNFDDTAPSDAQIQTMNKILIELCKAYKLKEDKIIFHRDVVSYKTCPGLNFSRIYINLKDNTELVERLKGKLLLAVENKGEVYFTNMAGLTLLVDKNNFLEVFKEMALGISNKDLNKLNLVREVVYGQGDV